MGEFPAPSALEMRPIVSSPMAAASQAAAPAALLVRASRYYVVKISVTTCTQGGSDCKAVRRGVREAVGNEGCVRSRRGVTVYGVFYKELEEGTYKIVNGNIILFI
jgi:hypothetical protein